jgi:hypothetical protein
MLDLTCTFTSELWLYPTSKAAWTFITLPQDDSDRIRFAAADRMRGFRSLRVRVTIGKTVWVTSIFPDSKRGAYLLPVKAEVRKAEQLAVGKKAKVRVEVLV